MSGDAHHITSPPDNGEGAQLAMRMCLKDGLIDPAEVDYINAHGTSTQQGDVAETRAVKAVFGDHARKLVFNSTKSMTGHLLGAAGGLEFWRLHPGRLDLQDSADHQSGHAGSRMRSVLGAQQDDRASDPGGAVQLLRLRRAQRDSRSPEIRRVTALL